MGSRKSAQKKSLLIVTVTAASGGEKDVAVDGVIGQDGILVVVIVVVESRPRALDLEALKGRNPGRHPGPNFLLEILVVHVAIVHVRLVLLLIKKQMRSSLRQRRHILSCNETESSLTNSEFWLH